MTTAKYSQKGPLNSNSFHAQAGSSKTKKKTNKPRPVCKTCGNSFSKPANLKAHERIHTGEKRYACHICNKRFVWKSSLNFHSRTAHKELNSTPPATVNEESDLTSLVPTTVSSNTPSTPPSGTENGYSTFSSQETSGSTSRDFSETADQIESPLVVKREPELIQTHTNKWPTGNENDLERYFQDPGTVPPTSDSQTRMDEQYALNRSQREFEVDTYVSSPLLPFSSLLTPLEDFHLL